MKRILLIALLAALACQTRQPQPVDIEAADMCALCRMAISEKPYAAEAIDQDGNAYKFDDIGCLVRFLGERGPERRRAALFVMDYEARQWVEAEGAHYVKSQAIRSPMASGLIALKDRAKAEQYSARFNGQVLAFQDLWGK